MEGLLGGEWRHLVLLSFRVDPALLASRVPAGTALDLWSGECYLSVVGLRFQKLQLLGFPLPLHQDFAQVNLRFYVQREASGPRGPETRHGAVFVRELVPRPFLAAAARLAMNEPFLDASLRHRVELDPASAGAPALVEYAWDDPGEGGRVRAEPSGPAAPLQPGSLEEFIAERCWGYTPQRDGGTVEYRVEHPRWLVRPRVRAELAGDLEAVFPPDLVGALRAPPAHAFLAEGSAVRVHAPTRL